MSDKIVLCADCKHVAPEQQPNQGLYCGHPDAPVEPVDGTPAVRCHWMRAAENKNPGYPKCGPDGALYEQKRRAR